ncbi:Myb-like DNA-binding domain containing protein [Trichomonas vaginalis G3]|uniref:Myb-like DNA-binding domain containing protein n=1 Tax=Trichomonas vaginalis (strain ATCC PRA-98 / G3) TaxID=412133 RepID=A2F079_TRIV3|nr:RNA polymerase II transcription regulator recruiting protein [Trichomonas vaginalis G3]EAY01714.1 Myb-like DNA-binding domain containing protein [Trichomonas vaginalis G3]KAI5489646.1 RNA polymerase II transcription regulator recruiting protein [Trichomonas vaginalis G3]|eukprot:XP_001330410.1 Myb-like DNA-binding domain containing protein [Trichomonas vaginalis G3]
MFCDDQDDDSSCSKPPDLTKRKRFSKEEDMRLKQLVSGGRDRSWDQIAREMPGRTARQCRDRYNKYLFKEISSASWTSEEDEIILQMHKIHGPKWSLISKSLDGRSGNNVKNRWYKFLSKQQSNSANPQISTEPESENDVEGSIIMHNLNHEFGSFIGTVFEQNYDTFDEWETFTL